MEPTELLKNVATLAKKGMSQKQIAEELGFKVTFTLSGRLVKASQVTGKLPAFGVAIKHQVEKRAETVEMKRRGKGDAFVVMVKSRVLRFSGGDFTESCFRPRISHPRSPQKSSLTR